MEGGAVVGIRKVDIPAKERRVAWRCWLAERRVQHSSGCVQQRAVTPKPPHDGKRLVCIRDFDNNSYCSMLCAKEKFSPTVPTDCRADTMACESR